MNSEGRFRHPITRDEVKGPNESFQVKLANARGGATLVGSVATVTIADLDSVVQFSGRFLRVGGGFAALRTTSLTL